MGLKRKPAGEPVVKHFVDAGTQTEPPLLKDQSAVLDCPVKENLTPESKRRMTAPDQAMARTLSW